MNSYETQMSHWCTIGVRKHHILWRQQNYDFKTKIVPKDSIYLLPLKFTDAKIVLNDAQCSYLLLKCSLVTLICVTICPGMLGSVDCFLTGVFRPGLSICPARGSFCGSRSRVSCPAAVRVVREPLQHAGRVGSSSFHGVRWSHHNAALPSSQTQQAHHLRRVAQLWQMGDGAHWYHHETQAGRRAVRRSVRGRLEEIQPDCGCQNTKGQWQRDCPDYIENLLNVMWLVFVLTSCCFIAFWGSCWHLIWQASTFHQNYLLLALFFLVLGHDTKHWIRA